MQHNQRSSLWHFTRVAFSPTVSVQHHKGFLEGLSTIDVAFGCSITRVSVQVFVSDKKRSKEFGGSEAFNRIKKELVKEMKGLGPEEQVLLIGCSAAPHICVKKDEKAFMGFFDKHIYLPLPDYASRLVRASSTSWCPPEPHSVACNR